MFTASVLHEAITRLPTTAMSLKAAQHIQAAPTEETIAAEGYVRIPVHARKVITSRQCATAPVSRDRFQQTRILLRTREESILHHGKTTRSHQETLLEPIRTPLHPTIPLQEVQIGITVAHEALAAEAATVVQDLALPVLPEAGVTNLI